MLANANLIGEGQNSLIYLHAGERYDRPVILKVLKEDQNYYPHTTEISNEDSHTRHLNIKGVRSSLDLLEVENQKILVLEYFEGRTIKELIRENSLSFVDKLHIAVSICQSLHQVHEKEIIHHDISSNNILINQDKETCLIDFGLASNINMKLDIGGTSEQQLAGTLPYVSPEQTGRVNHAVDQRSDLYSLGAVFYELFSGKVPFTTTDPMELVHAHLAIKPQPLHEVAQGIPVVLSDIILKLLSKDVERRYQSAGGLYADLKQCLNQLEMQVAIESFSLGQKDQSGRFLIPSRLYGREHDVATLIDSFDRLGEGTKEITLISGHSGTGKTSLVYEIHKPVTKKRGIFLSGKYEQLKKDRPYLAISQAFQGFFNLILSENEEILSYWKKLISDALGNEGKLLTDMIPNLELIIGKQPPLETLGLKETQNRFNYTFLKFITALAQEKHPMVMFVDDLQWADLASLELLQSVVEKEDLRHFYFIGAYRDNEIDASHPTSLLFDKLQEKDVRIHHINLTGLQKEDVGALIADTFSLQQESAMTLAEIAFTKTAGNPFFLNQFLKSIYERGFIIYDRSSNSWKWDETHLESMNFTDNVVAFMIEKIRTMDPIVQKTLQLASCIGDRFDLRTLVAISHYSLSDMKVNIWTSVKEQLIVVQKNNPDHAYLRDDLPNDPEQYITYKFAHDRIRQAAYELIPEEEKVGLHQQIGQLLLQKTDESQVKEFIFDIVYQLNKGDVARLSADQKHQLIKLNYIAGQRAKASTAYKTALSYYSIALSMLDEEFEAKEPAIHFQLHLESMECNYLNAAYDRMHEIANKLLAAERTLLEEFKIKNVIIHAYIAQSRYEELLDLAVKILGKAGIKIPLVAKDKDIIVGLVKTKLLFRNKKDQYFENLPKMSDEVIRIAINMISSVSTASYHSFPKLFPVAIFKSLQLAVKYGNSLDTLSFYGGYGSILCGVTGEYEKGYEYGKLSLKLVDLYDDSKAAQPKTYVIFGAFICHWRDHLNQCVEYLRQAYTISMETGDRQYAGSGLYLEAYTRFWTGQNLDILKPILEGHLKKLQELNQTSETLWMRIFVQFVQKLHQASANGWELSGDTFDTTAYLEANADPSSQDRTALFHIHFHQMWLYFIGGQYEDALKHADLTSKNIDVVMSTIYVPLFHFYDALISLKIAQTANAARKGLIKRAKKSIRKFKKWSEHAPMNHLHKYHLMEAVRLSVEGNPTQAVTHFQKSIEGASVNGYVNELALAYDFFAGHYRFLGQSEEEMAYLRKAHTSYKQWGVENKIQLLEEQHPNLVFTTESLTLSSDFKSITSHSIGNKLLDLSTIIKASAAIASEIQLDKAISSLLKIVIENAGAQTGVFLLQSGDQLSVYAKGDISEGIELIQPETSDHESLYPMSVIQYVQRTKEKLVIESVIESGQFLTDPYIVDNEVKSILCIPVLYQGEILGVIYMENNLMKGAFTVQRIDLLTVLSGQIAVTLNNALLYDNLEQKVEERTQQIEAQKEQLNQQNVTLKDLNGEKDYLISMVSHDLRTPLYGIKGFAGLAAKKIDHEKIRDFTNPIIDSIDRLDKMITRILDISAINAKEIKSDPIPFELWTLLHELVETHQILAKEKNIALTLADTTEQMQVLLDRGALSQVINNLLSNALKFTSEEGQVDVHVKKADNEYVIEVRDNGPGIPLQDQKLLFSQFRKLTPQATAGEQSSGLGLAIVKKYVDSMHGRVWCESSLGEGTSFFIALPTSQETPSA